MSELLGIGRSIEPTGAKSLCGEAFLNSCAQWICKCLTQKDLTAWNMPLLRRSSAGHSTPASQRQNMPPLGAANALITPKPQHSVP